MRLGVFGKELTDIQTKLRFYVHYAHDLKAAKSGKITESQKMREGAALNESEKNKAYWMEVVEYGYKDFESQLRDVFLNALRKLDSRRIIEIGEAIEVLEIVSTGKRVDPYRVDILYWRRALESKSEKWAIRRLAMEIKWPDMSQDGLRRLRRLCRELKFPLAPSGQISV